jgi:MFS family permease
VTAATATSLPEDRLARRNALVLAAAQACGGATASIVIATGGLAGFYLLAEDKSLATLPVTAFVTGTACGSVPAALLQRRLGRRLGLIIGALIALVGGLVSAWAVAASSFWIFGLGTFISGFAGAFVQQYRFAAADTASESFKPRAISWVLAGGVLAGIIGPQTVIFTKDLLLPIEFAGAYLGQALLALVTIGILSFLRIPQPVRLSAADGGRPLSEIVAQHRFIVAALCGMVTYGLMSLVMTATPLAMVAHDHSQADAALGIQWHVLAMFGPSFFTGSLIARFGKETIVAVGLALLAGCGVVALLGYDVMHFWLALALLGLGWNFGFIGATAMVTDCHRPEERAKVQATNDFLIFACVALASFSSGRLLDAFGWETVNWLIFPFVLAGLAVLAHLVFGKRLRRAPV